MTPGVCTFKVPSWRVDLKQEVDLIGEVGQLRGVNNIQHAAARAIGANEFDSVYDQIAEVQRILSSLGLNEARGKR